MERDFDTFDPNEALVDEGRNLYYPANWQKGDPVFVLNDVGLPIIDEQSVADYLGEPGMYGGNLSNYCPDCGDDLSLVMNHICGLEQRKGLDCE